MFDANEYKLLAEKCLKLAETARNAREERALLEIAWGFAQLACGTCETAVPERGANQIERGITWLSYNEGLLPSGRWRSAASRQAGSRSRRRGLARSR